MKFFTLHKKLYPVLALACAVFVIVFGLVTARTVACSVFLACVFVWLALFGCFKACLKALPVLVVACGAFFGIAYGASGGSAAYAMAMANRIGAVCMAVIPGMSTEPAATCRNLSQLKVPRGVTLGMLIALSFMPVLRAEISRVREAMKTRGAGSMWNPKLFYRAFLIPFVTRLVDISDTLALSVETRGFTLGKADYTVYKREFIGLFDIIFLLGLTAGAVLTVVL